VKTTRPNHRVCVASVHTCQRSHRVTTHHAGHNESLLHDLAVANQIVESSTRAEDIPQRVDKDVHCNRRSNHQESRDGVQLSQTVLRDCQDGCNEDRVELQEGGVLG
jgi:hypothetical protein